MIRRVFAVIICLPMLMLSSCNPGDVCGPDMIIDCSGACVDEFDVNDSLGDDMCDENLNCSEFNHDGGDCDDNESTTTTTAVTPTPTTTTIDEATTTTTTDCRRRGCTTTIGESTSTTTIDCERIPRLCITTTTGPSDDDCEPYVICSDSLPCTTDAPCTITCFEMPEGWEQTKTHAEACEEFGWTTPGVPIDKGGFREHYLSCDSCQDRRRPCPYNCSTACERFEAEYPHLYSCDVN